MRRLFRFALLLTFLLALDIRLYDLTDPPFDFHSTRQFRSAVIAPQTSTNSTANRSLRSISRRALGFLMREKGL